MTRPRKDPSKLADRRRSRMAPRLVELDNERDRRVREELSAQVPPKLLKLTVQHWDSYWASDIASIATAADLPSLQRLFMARDEREKLWREYRRGRFVYGSRQQIAMHPVFGAVRVLDAEITALEDRFGLNPRARARLGLSFVKAKLSMAEINLKVDAQVEAAEARGEISDPRDLPDPYNRSKGAD